MPDVGDFKRKAMILICFVSGLSIVLIHYFKHPSSSIAADSSQGGGFNQN